MGKYADLFEPATAGPAKGKYADLFDTGEIPTYDPQTVTDADIVPTPGELSTLEAPEGSPQREEINKSVAGNLFAPPGKFARDPTLAELVNSALPRSVQESQREEGRIPLAPPLPEQGAFEQGGVLGVTIPAVEAGGELVGGMIPHNWEEYLAQIYPPAAAYHVGKHLAQGDVSDIPLVGRVPEIMAAEETPAFSKERYMTALRTLMDVGALGGAAAEGVPSRLRTEPLAPEPPPTVSLGPGTIAGDVSRALERRFTLQDTPPEPRPELAPAPPIEETLPRTAPPIVSPETGFGHYPTEAPATEPRPVRTEFAVSPGALKMLDRLRAHRAQVEGINGQVDPKVTQKIAEIEQRVQHGQFAKPGYTAVDTPVETTQTQSNVVPTVPTRPTGPTLNWQPEGEGKFNVFEKNVHTKVEADPEGNVRLRGVVVQQGERGRGAGRGFVEKLVNDAAQQFPNAREAVVWAFPTEQGFWQKVGFEPTGRTAEAGEIGPVAELRRPLREGPVQAPGGADIASEAPGGVPVADPLANLPEYMRENVRNDAARLEANGMADQIEELAAQRLTAGEIARKLGLEKHEVMAVRLTRGIPPMNTGGGGPQFSPEFEAWVAKRQAKPSPPSAGAPEVAPEPYTQEAAAQRAAAQPQAPPVQTDLPESAFDTKRAQKIYGDDAVLITKGKSAKAWKAIGQADKRNPYDVLQKARARKIALPDEAANLRAEHQRLLERARQQYGTPEYNDLAQNAVDFLNASKEVIHGPASDLFRGLQEADKPTYMSPADYDNILRERQMQATPDETATFQKVTDEVRNGDKQARDAAANGQEALRKYRPRDVVSFDKAVDHIKNQIKDLTEPCAL